MNLEGCGKKVRELIQKHIRSSGIELLNEEPVSVMNEGEFGAKIDELESDEARASEMQQAIKHEISVRYDEDPVQYGSLQERVEDLIEQYRQGRLSEREIIEELQGLMDEMRSRDREAEAMGLDGETQLARSIMPSNTCWMMRSTKVPKRSCLNSLLPSLNGLRNTSTKSTGSRRSTSNSCGGRALKSNSTNATSHSVTISATR